MTKQSFALLISAALVLTGLAVSYSLVAQAQTNLNSSVSVKKQVDDGLFTITVNDSDGIQEFNFQPATGARYGGELKCPKTFSNNNVLFIESEAFTPAMKVTITDCKKNVAEFEIGPLTNGSGKGVLINQPKVEPVPAPTPTPAPKPEQKEESAALSKDDVKYPIKELGNCGSEMACRTYCDKPDNYSECFSFAKKFGLLDEKLTNKSEAELEDFAKTLKTGGPGGCKDQKSCEAYCNDTSRLNECLAFGEKHGLMDQKDLEEGRKIQAILAQGGTLPGGCKNKNECEAYCSGGDHIEECLAFAEKAGFMPPEELKQARKAMEFMARGETPGNCKSKTQCEAYCEDESHFEACIAFAEKAGFMSQDELKMAKKSGGKGPGGCRGKSQCETFCQDERNIEQCLAFAEEHGLMKKEDVERARKTGGKGPGGCRGKACETYCDTPDHQEVCVEFAKEHGLLSEEDLKRLEEGQQSFQNALNQAPPEVKECLAKMGINESTPPRRGIEKEMRECFQSFQGAGGPGGGGPGGQHNEEFSRQHNEETSSQYHQQGGFPGGRNEGNEQYSGATYPADEKLGQCDPGFAVVLNPKTNRQYCAIQSCKEGAYLTQDSSGYSVCWMQSPSSTHDSKISAEQYSGGRPATHDSKISSEQYLGGDKRTMCPAMPTIDSCPDGQEKFAAYSSPDCGTYYACRPKQQEYQYDGLDRKVSPQPQPQPYQTPSPEQYQQEYQKQYEQQYQQEYQKQYEQSYPQTEPIHEEPKPASVNLESSLMAQVLGLVVNLLKL
ncbi:MAG: hypothetical protein G01um101419_301 [Parcubacteria group bacterium Gr01-1014_19]|nr:MAG: hypothetical protein G01um101419_301 [Parcubacteria group bacterium Gr01-1014_19]